MTSSEATWWERVKTDFFRKEYQPLKFLFFFMVGGMTTLFPFLTIQARSLGISGEELGIIYSLLPIVGIFAPSLAGLLADKIGNFKIFLSASVLCSGLAALLFLLIPPGRITHNLPAELPLLLECNMNDSEVTVVHPLTCDALSNSSNETQMSSLNIDQCTYSCSDSILEDTSVDRFLADWCNGKDHCLTSMEDSVEIVNETSSKEIYSVDGEDVHPNVQMRFTNFSVPVEFWEDESNTKFKVLQGFCPDFTQLQEYLGDKSNCSLKCNATSQTSKLCSNTISVETLNPSLTVISYIVIRVTNGLTLATSFTLFEGAVVAILKESDGDLGFQRVYGNLGMIVLTPISGKLIDLFSTWNNKEDYSPAFYLYCAIKVLSAFAMLFINLEFKQPSNRVLKDFKELIVQPPVATFILFTVVSGTCFGFVETFLFWLLEDLGADKSLMGMTITVGSAVGIPLLMVSSFFINKLGHVNTLALCMSIYVIRLLGYSFIQNPWLAMPFEALECYTNSLMGVTSISYAGVLSSPSTVASLQGLYGGTYNGVGRGLGSLAGGIMIKRIGNSGTFQILAALSGVTGLAYFLINKLIFLRNKPQIGDKSAETTEDGLKKSLETKDHSEQAGAEPQFLKTQNDEGSTKISNGETNLSYENTP